MSAGRIVEKLRRATPSSSPARTEQVIAGAVTELLSRHRVQAVGLGAAGFIDEERASVRFAPNLAWREEPLRLRVEDLIGLPVVVENDANASAWAEVRFGAARGHAHVIFVGVGTGIGAGIVLDGRLYRGQWGMAGEPGHYRVVPDGRLCGCGNRGCWEQYASGSALVAEAREFARRSPGAAVRLLQLAGGSPDGITGSQVTQAAREGDPVAARCFATVGGWLGQGLADLAAILDPGCFVIGGGVSDAGELLLGPARAAFEKALPGGSHRHQAQIKLAQLGADAGIVGAADLARGAVRGTGRRAGRATAAGTNGRTGLTGRSYTTAPSSGPESPGGRSPIRTTRVANPPTKATYRAERRPARHHPAQQDGQQQIPGPAEQRRPGALAHRVQPGQRRRDRRDVVLVVTGGRERRRGRRPDDAGLGLSGNHAGDGIPSPRGRLGRARVFPVSARRRLLVGWRRPPGSPVGHGQSRDRGRTAAASPGIAGAGGAGGSGCATCIRYVH